MPRAAGKRYGPIHLGYLTAVCALKKVLPVRDIGALLSAGQQTGKDNAEAVSDLSEDMRQELDNIYQAIAALSIKVPQARKPSQPIGFKPTTKK